MVSLTGDRKTMALVKAPATHSQVSPDGKWLAYASGQTGRGEVYVTPFPTGDGKWLVSSNGGSQPRWRADGRELFYLTSGTGTHNIKPVYSVSNAAIQ